MKLIIPLLDKNITKDDLTEEAGFIDAYNYDINRPALDDCIFLMYDADKRTDEANKRFQKFEKLKTIRSSKTIYVNNKPYTVYAFVIIDHDIRNLLKGLRHTKMSSYTQFVQFWKATDGAVNRYMVFPTELFNHEVHSVPEADYQYTISELRAKNSKRRVPI